MKIELECLKAVRIHGWIGDYSTFHSGGQGSIPDRGGDFSVEENHRPGFRTGCICGKYK